MKIYARCRVRFKCISLKPMNPFEVMLQSSIILFVLPVALTCRPTGTSLQSLKHLTHSHTPPQLLLISASTWSSFQYFGFSVSLASQLQWSNLPPTSASLFAIHTVITHDCTASFGLISILFSDLHLLSWLTPSGTPILTIHWTHPCFHCPSPP